MVIRANDRLEDVLRADESMLDRFVAASPALAGLRNPTTRRVMGRLATVGDVARMAGLDPDILVRRLNRAMEDDPQSDGPDTGGDAGSANPIPTPRTAEKEATVISTRIPPFLAALPEDRRFDLDVRDDLRNGREPFSRIMAARAILPRDGVLRLRATFEPHPLYAVLSRQGYEHFTEQLAPDDWRVWFHPRHLAEEADADAAARSAQADTPSPPRGAPAPVAKGGDPDEHMVVLDVRGMDPPEPLVHTLAALETLPTGSTLLQINERVPEFLLPRLAELGFAYEIREQAEGVVRVFIRRAADEAPTDLEPVSGPASR